MPDERDVLPMPFEPPETTAAALEERLRDFKRLADAEEKNKREVQQLLEARVVAAEAAAEKTRLDRAAEARANATVKRIAAAIGSGVMLIGAAFAADAHVDTKVEKSEARSAGALDEHKKSEKAERDQERKEAREDRRGDSLKLDAVLARMFIVNPAPTPMPATVPLPVKDGGR